MPLQIIPKSKQAYGQFNHGEIVENKPIGFNREGGLKPYSNLFYWAHAQGRVDSTIGLHPHEGFEIMSFVLKGSIRHFDTKLNEWRPLQTGDAQIIRAGNGISHAEFLAKDSAIFQIWFDPDLTKTLNQPPSYDDYKSAGLPVEKHGDATVKTYVGEGSPITLDTPGLEIREVSFDKLLYQWDLRSDKIYSIYVMEGSFSINGEKVQEDDFVIISDSAELKVKSDAPGKFFMIATPAKLDYKTYAQLMQERMRA